MGRPRIVIYRPIDASERSHRELVAAGCDVSTESIDTPGAAVSKGAANAVVLMGATFRDGVMDHAFLRQFPGLRLVSKYTIGFDDVDLAAATELGVLVTHCPTEANFGGVAEGTMAMILAMLKKVRERDRRVKSGAWRDATLEGVYLGAREDGYPGITVGIIGLGRVGSRLAELLGPWRVRILACDPYVDAVKFQSLRVAPSELAELLAESDVVTLHCDLNASTSNLIDADRIGLMKPGAILVNTARGAIVDLDALTAAIESGALGGAALDVFPEEPPPAEARVLGLGDKVLLMPHMVAANQGGTLAAAIPWATAASLAAVRGICPDHVVNEDAVGRWMERFGGKSLL